MKVTQLPTADTINGRAVSGVDAIRTVVLVLPFWKSGSDLKRVNAYLEIEDALDSVSSDLKLKLSLDAHQYLEQSMEMQGASITDPPFNRYYMRVFRAVLKADDEKE